MNAACGSRCTLHPFPYLTIPVFYQPPFLDPSPSPLPFRRHPPSLPHQPALEVHALHLYPPLLSGLAKCVATIRTTAGHVTLVVPPTAEVIDANPSPHAHLRTTGGRETPAIAPPLSAMLGWEVRARAKAKVPRGVTLAAAMGRLATSAVATTPHAATLAARGAAEGLRERRHSMLPLTQLHWRASLAEA